MLNKKESYRDLKRLNSALMKEKSDLVKRCNHYYDISVVFATTLYQTAPDHNIFIKGNGLTNAFIDDIKNRVDVLNKKSSPPVEN